MGTRKRTAPPEAPELQDWQARLRAELAARADPRRAAQMQAYMKSALPYYGVPMAEVRKLARRFGAEVTFEAFPAFERFLRAFWSQARHREERYVALSLLDLKHTRRFQTLEAVPLYEWLILDGAWWDLVDEIATHRFAPLLQTDRAAMVKVLRRWAHGPAMWLRRAAIIAQVLSHEATDCQLLFELIEPALGEKEFFLRKAIGWALRAAAREHPREVRAWLEQNEERLSGLSRREALKGFRPAAPRRARGAG